MPSLRPFAPRRIASLTRSAVLKVAAAQYPIDQPASLDSVAGEGRTLGSGRRGNRRALLVFPEYAAIEQAATFGAEVSGNLEATLKAVADLEHERVDFHRELAARHKVHILVGSGPARRGAAATSMPRSSSRLRARSACRKSAS